MRQLRHPLTGNTYEVGDDGQVLVTDGAGRRGTFNRDGAWVRGELRTADPELCQWIDSGDTLNERLLANRRFSILVEPAVDGGT
jgi:hypothetical protein